MTIDVDRLHQIASENNDLAMLARVALEMIDSVESLTVRYVRFQSMLTTIIARIDKIAAAEEIGS